MVAVLSWCRGEWVDYTFAANLQPCLARVLGKDGRVGTKMLLPGECAWKVLVVLERKKDFFQLEYFNFMSVQIENNYVIWRNHFFGSLFVVKYDDLFFQTLVLYCIHTKFFIRREYIIHF